MPNAWEILAAPLAPAAIKHREGPRGIQLAYIDRGVVYERLEKAAPGQWHLSLVALPFVEAIGADDRIAVKATLTVIDVVREDIGTGKDWKEAATDAFKRAAVHFGIGRELYEKGSGANGGGAVPGVVGGKPASSAKPVAAHKKGKVMPFGKHKGKLLSAVPANDLESTIAWCKSKGGGFDDLIASCEAELASRSVPVGSDDDFPDALRDGPDSLPFD